MTALPEAAVGLLLELLDTPAPSGFEGPASDLVRRHAATFADEVVLDVVGSCRATVNAAAVGDHVAIMGHIDEIGFIVTKIDEHGMLRFDQIGGWDPAVATGQRVRVLCAAGERVGIITRAPIHEIKSGDESKIELRDLWIDIAATDRDEAAAHVQVGDPIVVEARPVQYDNGRLMSRSLDDRLGVFVALEVARRTASSGVKVSAIASAAEETSFAGAYTSSFSARPDAVCVVDVTAGTDGPGDDRREQIALGKGPVILFGAATRSAIGRELVSVARERDIDVQISASGRATWTDADAVVATGAGIPTGAVLIPTHNLHTPGEICDLADVEATIQLLAAWVERHKV